MRYTQVLVFAVVAAAAYLMWPRADESHACRATVDRERDAGGNAATEAGGATDAAKQQSEQHGEASKETWTLTILGAGDRPMPGVNVGTKGGGGGWLTDLDGRIEVDAQTTVVVLGSVIAVDRPETVYRMPDMIPAVVEIVDASTGKELWGGEVHFSDDAVPKRDGRYTFGLNRGLNAHVCYELTAPPGYASVIPQLFRGRFVSGYAKSVRIVKPVWPEARISVRIVDPRGEWVRLASIESVSMGRQRLGFETVEKGERILVAGVPDLRGGEVHVGAKGMRAGDSFYRGSAKCTLAGDGRTIAMTIRLSEKLGAFSAPPRAPPSAFHLSPPPFVAAIGHGTGKERPSAFGSIYVVVRRHDGSAADGIVVRVRQGRRSFGKWLQHGSTDRDGARRFAELPAGTFTVTAEETGFVHASKTIELAANAHGRVQLDEPQGWTGRFRVVDERGEPVPFARIDLRGTYALIEDGVQTIGLYTDRHGEIVLPRLSPERVSLIAYYGSRKSYEKVRETSSVIVLTVK